MSENKTKPNKESVSEFLSKISPESKQQDCRKLAELMEEITNCKPLIWGNMVGFDEYHYKYDSGREGDMFKIGFAPRAKNISVYGAAYDAALDQKKEQLGKVKLGKSCIYINQLEDVNLDLLKEVLEESIQIVDKRYPKG